MPTLTTHPARFAGHMLAAVCALTLSACGAKEEQFAPTCPTPGILRDAGDLHRFRGSGRDITDSILEGRITGLNGSCTRDGPDIVSTTISVEMELNRGPAAPGRIADVSYFVAVLDGERILEKRVYSLRAEFPPNTDRLRLNGDSVELRLPVTPQKSAGAYRISIGFQLTPTELEVNRQRSGRP